MVRNTAFAVAQPSTRPEQTSASTNTELMVGAARWTLIGANPCEMRLVRVRNTAFVVAQSSTRPAQTSASTNTELMVGTARWTLIGANPCEMRLVRVRNTAFVVAQPPLAQNKQNAHRVNGVLLAFAQTWR
jgi:hypothetical protein